MKTKSISNLIASITLALVPIGPLSLLLPAGEIIAGVLVLAGLAGLGLMELRQGAAVNLPTRQSKRSIELYRHIKSEA